VEYKIVYKDVDDMVDKINALNLNEKDVVICTRESNKGTHQRVIIKREDNSRIEIDLPFEFSYKLPTVEFANNNRYNYHDRFRKFGISKRDKFRRG